MTTFFGLIADSDKEGALLAAVRNCRLGVEAGNVYTKSIDQLKRIPGSPFAYWVVDRIADLFEGEKFESQTSDREALCGLSTLDNFRFLRLNWETRPRNGVWVNYYHGGVFSKFFDNFPLLIRWASNGAELKCFVERKVGSASRKIQGESRYFQEGFVFSRRTQAFAPKFMPRGGIFSTAGQAGFCSSDQLPAAIALLSSQVCNFLMSLSQGRTGAAAQFEVGLVKRIPWPSLTPERQALLGALALRAWRCRRKLETTNETSSAFLLPARLSAKAEGFDRSAIQSELEAIQYQIDREAMEVYGLNPEDRNDLEAINPIYLESAAAGDDEQDDEDGIEDLPQAQELDDFAHLLSWCVGVAFGRFDVRLATGARSAPIEPEPFDEIPDLSPGMLPPGDARFHGHSGVLVDDAGHPHDLARLIEEVLSQVTLPSPPDVRRWLRREFFSYHLQVYSQGRRRAPIYWPLCTRSGSYTLWIYYPDLSGQTLYIAINDFIEPKILQVASDAAALRKRGAALGRSENKDLELLQDLELELVELRDFLREVAKKYQIDQDDGVQINASPLWQLFHYAPWQRLLKETWAKLEKGEYDWAHLAMIHWPDRVRQKCKTDKSLAIAHGLESLYVEPEAAPKKTRGRKKGAEA